MGNAERYYGISVSTNQGAAVADVAALTSSANGALTSAQSAVPSASLTAIANAYNQLQADVVALRTSYNQAQVDIAALRTTLLALQDSLQAASVIAP